jgi:hypothetical protein
VSHTTEDTAYSIRHYGPRQSILNAAYEQSSNRNHASGTATIHLRRSRLCTITHGLDNGVQVVSLSAVKHRNQALPRGDETIFVVVTSPHGRLQTGVRHSPHPLSEAAYRKSKGRLARIGVGQSVWLALVSNRVAVGLIGLCSIA